MVRMFRACAASVMVALALVISGSTQARAQQTDGQFLIGGGIEPFSIAWTRTEIGSLPTQSTTTTHWGPSGDILLAFGYGFGAWVLALEAAFGNTTDTTEQVDIVTSASEVDYSVSRTTLTIGPSARLLLGEANVRPFVEAGIGLAIERLASGSSDSDSLALFVRCGPGLQLRLADAASLDVSFRVGYAAASGTIDPDVRVIVLDPASGEAEIGASDFTSSAIEVSTVARLSIWL